MKQILYGLTAFFFTFLPVLSAQDAAQLQQTSQDFEGVAEKSIPAVVSIQVAVPRGKSGAFSEYDFPLDDDIFSYFFGIPKREKGGKEPSISQASGFIISSDGYILTNNHVVQNGQTITVKLNDGREFQGKVIGTDESTDVALVKIEGQNLPFLPLGNSDALKVGQWVVAIGNPLGLQASLTVGVVSAKGRSNLDIAKVEDFIQTDAAINRGNSGGPLLNLKGEVVGMNTAIATNMGGYMGIGFAIPSNMAQHVMEQIKAHGTVSRGYLGVMLQPIDASLAKALDLSKIEGALVADVLKNSPAEKAGLKQGDIILKFNGTTVDTIGSLRNYIALQDPGTKIKLLIQRDKKQMELEFEVAVLQGEAKKTPDGTFELYGMKLQTLTKELAINLKRPEDTGVLVIQVDPNSIAALAGIKKGALIMTINQQKVESTEDIERLVAKTDKEKPLLLLIKQGDSMRFVSLFAD